MLFKNGHLNVSLFIKTDLMKKIEKIALENYPNESGGFFIGKYSNNL